MICDIKNITLKHRSIFGMKASSLGEMMNNNINVPKGLALSSEIYDEFLRDNGFAYEIDEYLQNNEDIQTFISNGSFSEKVTSKLEEFYHRSIETNKTKKFVVRSSALCEDNEEFSMAGLFSSYINLCSFDEIVTSIKKCYASLFEDKVLAFMVNNSLDMKKLKMAVLVQEFIEGEISGVIFSADNIEMNSEIICINFVEGICEKYVSGKASSSLYKIDKFTGKEVSKVVSDEVRSIPAQLLEKLYNKTLKIEKIFGCFQDVEWTIQNEEIYILQSRPITTFKEKNFIINWKQPKDKEYSWRLGPPFPFPPLVLDICPIEEEAFLQGAYETGYNEHCMARTIQNGYIYFRKKEIMDCKKKREAFFKYVDDMFEKGINIFQDVIKPELDKRRNILNNFLNKKLSNMDLIKFLDLSIEYLKVSSRSHWPAQGGIRYIESFRKYCKGILGKISTQDYYDLIYQQSMLTKEREALIKMADIVKLDAYLIKLFDKCKYDEILVNKLKKYPQSIVLIKCVQDYLKDYGISEAGFDDAIRPVLWERQDGVVRKIKAMLEIDSKKYFDSIKAIGENKEKVIKNILMKLNKAEQDSFFEKLKVAEKAFLVADDHNYYIDRQAWGYLRLAVMEAGKALAAETIISNEKDIFFLRLEEIKRALINKNIKDINVKERKELLKKQKHLLPPRNIGQQQEKAKNSDVKNENKIESDQIITELKGIATFDGKIRGKVRKGIPKDIGEDCILVVHDGHGTDIIHLLSKVKGLIFENGSPFDHLGIISREMNIPAIYYVKDAFVKLKQEAVIEIDGDSNSIKIVSSK